MRSHIEATLPRARTRPGRRARPGHSAGHQRGSNGWSPFHDGPVPLLIRTATAAVEIREAPAIARAEEPRRLVVRPSEGSDGVDVTHGVIAAIAYAIWERRGGGALDNWLEAERLCGVLAGRVSGRD